MKVGLVLGGGGARGFAHIGVLKVFSRAGIPVDCLAGSSMGGFIAAANASGLSTLELDVEAVRMTRLTRLVSLVDLAGPRRGLIVGARLREYLCSLFGPETQIDALPVPLALTAVDLLTGKLVILREGKLVDAVMATLAVPGLLPAVEMDGRRLVDGGILNNIPVDVARGMGAEVTIAVDVSPRLCGEQGELGPSGQEWPGWFPAFAQDFYLAELIMVSALSAIHLQEAQPDLVILPSLPPGVSIFWGFTRAAEAIQAGELATQECLPELERLLKAG